MMVVFAENTFRWEEQQTGEHNAVTFVRKVHWSRVCFKNSTESQSCKQLEYASEITGEAMT